MAIKQQAALNVATFACAAARWGGEGFSVQQATPRLVSRCSALNRQIDARGLMSAARQRMVTVVKREAIMRRGDANVDQHQTRMTPPERGVRVPAKVEPEGPTPPARLSADGANTTAHLLPSVDRL